MPANQRVAIAGGTIPAPLAGVPLASDVMTHRPTAILHTASIRAALAVMLELDVRHLPVVNEDHELVGMLSDRDLRGLPHVHRELDALAAPSTIDLDEPVATLMSSDVIAAEPGDELTDVLETMLENRIGAVPIVSPERRLVGIVSYLDALRAYQRDLAASSAP